jgi:methionyl-tRNA formyltransferase
MGTSAFAVPALERLLDEGHPVVAVYTQPPRPAGRGQKLQPTPMHEAALRLGLAIRTPASLKDPAAQADFAALDADLAIVGAYGLILPRPILAAPRHGCVNLHASLLPRWRGAAPIQRAILAGDEETGLSIFRMEPGLDTGPVHLMQPTPIGPDDTTRTVHDRLAAMAATLLPGLIEAIAAGTAVAVPQPAAGVTYAQKITKDEGRLDLSKPAQEVERHLRALNPWPGSWVAAGEERLLLLEGEVVEGAGPPGTIIAAPLTIACGEGAFRVSRLQRAGRKPMTPDELLRGFRLPVGSRLG